MPWRCPACEIPIEHSALEPAPRVGVAYRCHVCRLELQLNPRTGRLAVPPFDADLPTPARGFPSQLTHKPPTKNR